MIKFILLVNKQGHTRFSNYYDRDINKEERGWIEAEIVRKCLTKSQKQCSFLEYKNYQVVFRRYASLFFIVGIDEDENELAIYEFIHNLVEILDKYFKGVCELDLIYNLEKAHIIVDEMICNGHIIETCSKKVLAPLTYLDKMSN